MTTESIELFYSYAHEDEKLRKRLETHLSMLQRQGLIVGWHDREISAGGLWAQEIDEHLRTARIILLLISSYFIDSDYCYGVEMKLALERHEKREACVIPVILRPCDWEKAPFGKLQALPRDALPVIKWRPQDEGFLDIARGIRRVVEQMGGTISSTAPEPEPRPARKTGKRVKETTMADAPDRPEAATFRGPSSAPVMPAPARPPSFDAPALKRAVSTYYKRIKEYRSRPETNNEANLRRAFEGLLGEYARHMGWTLVVEPTLPNGARPDGELRDSYFPRGYWEAKVPKSRREFEREIDAKISKGYPLNNIIFDNTSEAILYQRRQRSGPYKLSEPEELTELLEQFFSYTEQEIDDFEQAVEKFKQLIPRLAQGMLEMLEQAHRQNRRFISAFQSFMELCQRTLDPQISRAEIDEMLIQHLLTERIFRTVFDNPDFIHQNAIAVEIEQVIQALIGFNRSEFLRPLDHFYNTIERAAASQQEWTEKQRFLNTVYERFFQGFAVKQADVHGIVYTPPEIVDFMCKSVDAVLQREFGKRLATPGVQILDPCVGTGNFIVTLMRPMTPDQLEAKYNADLFCNEITLLPYYIASLNIEHEYYVKTGRYEPFDGICFVDTLTLEGAQKELPMFSEKNTQRILREREAEIMVVLGNPPYNVGQKNENDNNKNRKYAALDKRVYDTYMKDSKATNTRAVSDVYVKFFRWATDRLGGRDGVICLVTNNSFVDQIAFDGMRKNLLQDFNLIYHLDLHGNVRKNPKLSGTTHNVFGIQIGVGITVAVRNAQNPERKLYYYRVPEDWRKTDKFAFLEMGGGVSMASIGKNCSRMNGIPGLARDSSPNLPLLPF